MTREEAIRLLDINREYLKNTNNIGLRDDIEALNMAIKALEQEPCEIIHSCTYGGVSWGGTYKPQEPKTGHWMKQDLGYKCSNCTLCTNEKGRLTYNYCPNCGAKMVEPQGRSGKE